MRYVCLVLQVAVVVLQQLEVAMITLSSQLGSTRKIPRRVSLAFSGVETSTTEAAMTTIVVSSCPGLSASPRLAMDRVDRETPGVGPSTEVSGGARAH